jgi:endonuclease IV
MILGAHESVAGGVQLAPERGAADGAEALQIFTKNASQWRSPAIAAAAPALFAAACQAHGIRAVMAHDSYLINLASPDEALRDRSAEALALALATGAATASTSTGSWAASASGPDTWRVAANDTAKEMNASA